MGFFFQGLTLGLAYVAPIGMQNLFVIDSALTKPRRRALLTALIVLFFDVSLSLSCFFRHRQAHAGPRMAEAGHSGDRRLGGHPYRRGSAVSRQGWR